MLELLTIFVIGCLVYFARKIWPNRDKFRNENLDKVIFFAWMAANIGLVVLMEISPPTGVYLIIALPLTAISLFGMVACAYHVILITFFPKEEPVVVPEPMQEPEPAPDTSIEEKLSKILDDNKIR